MAPRNEKSASSVKTAAPRPAVRKAEQAISQASAKANQTNQVRPANEKRRPSEEALQRLISERAFILFERRGYEHGHHEADWIEAEAQVRREQKLS